MKTPFNRLATAAPRALDSLLVGGKQQQDSKNKKTSSKERTCSFDLDLSGLNLDSLPGRGGSVAGFSSGGSIAEEGGSVVTFEDLTEFTQELLAGNDAQENNGAGVVGPAAASPTGETPAPN
mmetsp:Transcript_13265/g.32247  ORF Transcript_13265/g.32247 Transcript_13265/m.32247 type:complete len:122 (+) Transcript_13265:224-589(+)